MECKKFCPQDQDQHTSGSVGSIHLLLFFSWALPELGCASLRLVPGSFPSPLSSAPFWRHHSLTHQTSSLPTGVCADSGSPGQWWPAHGGTCAMTAKNNSQRTTQMSLLKKCHHWKNTRINSKEAICRCLENDEEMSNHQHGCTRSKSCQTDLIFFSDRVNKGEAREVKEFDF